MFFLTGTDEHGQKIYRAALEAKKDTFIKNNLTFFIELYFSKKINIFNSKDKVYLFYKYFLSKISDCNKYNLDIENILIEFNGKILNG